MDLEPRRPTSLPVATGPLLILLGIGIHVGFAEWITHRPSQFAFSHHWVPVVLNDLGSIGLVLGCVILGVQLCRRP